MHEPTQFILWLTLLSLQQQAQRDGLTGLYNRRFFNETLKDHIESARRYARPLSLILLDIDQFKQINDTQGHTAGDAALKHLATCLQKTARKADMICRYGGDEFAILLPETEKDGAHHFIERLQHRLKQSTPVISISAGIASFPDAPLLEHADRELLQAKQKSEPLLRSEI